MAAIQKKISGDITQIEGKIFLGCTLKQVAHIVIGAVLEYINIKTLKSEFVGVIIAAACFANGWIKMGPMRKPFFKYMFEVGKFSFSQKERYKHLIELSDRKIRKELKKYKKTGKLDEEIILYFEESERIRKKINITEPIYAEYLALKEERENPHKEKTKIKRKNPTKGIKDFTLGMYYGAKTTVNDFIRDFKNRKDKKEEEKQKRIEMYKKELKL